MQRRTFISNTAKVAMGIPLLHFTACSSQQSMTNMNTDFQFQEMTIPEMQQGFQDGKFSIVDVVQAYLNRIEAIDKKGPALNSIIEVNPDAMDIARVLDKALQDGKAKGALHGIPIILKDNIDTHDKMSTTAGSRALKGSKPLQDSAVAAQLKAAGAIILAKANLSEWANFRGKLSTSGWSGLGGLTKNPYILDRNTCGSSAGSGVAASANFCMVAIGTETNGSIVCPATTNGIVGIKPTVGLISRSGIIPISFTQDTAGPMARTVTDAAICLGAMTGTDSKDSKTQQADRKVLNDYTPFLKKEGLTGKKIGLYSPAMDKHPQVDELVRAAIEDMKKQGATFVDIDKLAEESVGGDSFEIMLYEYKDGLNKYFASLGKDAPIKNLEDLIEFNKKDAEELKYFGQQYLEMAQEKGDLNTPEYKEALAKMHRVLHTGINKVMDDNGLDAIIAPTGSPAWKTDLVNGDNYLLGSSSPAARSGYPNITVPMGFIHELPVGLSFFGRAWSEPVLLEIAYAYEQATRHRTAPKFIMK